MQDRVSRSIRGGVHPAVLLALLLGLLPSRLPALVISEIMYHSEESDDRPYEYIELYNETADPVDLTGYWICNGVSFVFPRGTWIEGHSCLVVCANESAIQSKYGITNTIGDWYVSADASASLSNGGERIEICNTGGATVLEVRYNDRGKWPVGADGTGHSLEIRSPYIEVDDPDSWQLSNDLGGSPGLPNPCWDVEGAAPPSSGGGPVGVFTDHRDVGFPCNPGSTTYDDGSGSYTVSGSGLDIWTGGDQFQFAYVKADGDFNMTAHFASKQWAPGSRWGKVGIMARQDLTAASRYTMIQDHGADLQDAARLATRATHGGSDNKEEGGGTGDAHPAWVRLSRTGNTFRGYTSSDGVSWVQVGPDKDWSGAPSIVHLGLGVCSHDDCGLTTIVFDNVVISADILPPEDPGGGEDPPPAEGECVARIPVRINEAYLLTGGAEPWVELYNKSDAAIPLAGYHVTDDPADLTKYEIPAGVTIAPRGFLVLTEADVGFALALAAPGDRRFLALVEPAPSLRVVDAFNFDPQFEGYSEARIAGDDAAFAGAADPTRGASNQVSVTQDVVINEMMYHPIDNDPRKEYVELFNKGAAAVDLTGYSMSDGIRFSFADGTVISAGGYLVVARDPEFLRGIYGLPAGRIVGPETPEALDRFGFLRDEGERVTLSDALGRTVDTVRFHDGGEWPRWCDGKGSSLELIDADQDNRYGQAWDASDDSDKAVPQTFSYIGRHVDGEPELHVLLLDRGITLVDDISVIGGGVSTDDTPLIEEGETWKYFKGTQAPPAGWEQPGFNDASWLSGPTGIGYGDGDDATVLDDMRNNYVTVFCRKVFQVADPGAIDELVLSVVIDDGFYAYLNGTQVGSHNVSSKAYDAGAASAGEPVRVELDLTSFKNLLTAGDNVLAVQVHNGNLSSSDLSFIPRLVDRTTTVGEGVEQLTNGTFETNTRGWMIEGNHIRSGRTTQDPIDGSGSLKIIATGRGDNKVNRIEAPEADGYGLGQLNAGEDLLISLKARWVVGSQTLLTHGYQHEMARSHELAVPPDLGTPGAVNSVTLRQNAATGGNLGPVMTDVSNDPAVPAAGEDVTVRVKVRDSDGVDSVTLYYSFNNASALPASAGMQQVGDHLYEAVIPGQAQATTVVFYITAVDSLGAAGRYPVDILERSHPFLVNPPSASLSDLRYCIYRHDVKMPATPYASYRFYMTDADESRLSSRRRLSNDPVPGSFVFGSSDIYYEAHTRFSGSPWARGGWGGSFRIYMPKDHPLHGRMGSFNVEDNQGNALDARTRISHYLLRQNQGSTGAPYTEDFSLVRWQVNNRTTAIREHNWVPDGDFVQRWFPGDDDGDFLEMDDRFVINDDGNRSGSTDGYVLYPPPSPRSDGNGENKENYRWFFGLRANRGADDFSNFIAFAKVMDPGATPNAQYDEQIWDVANVEQILRVMAIERNIDDWDTWGCNRGKNCYFYRPEADGRFHLLMWDVELTYGNVNSFIIPPNPTDTFNVGKFSEVRRMLNRPAIRRMYYAILKEMVVGPDRWFHSDYLSDYATRLAAFGMARTDIAQPGGYIDQKAALLADRIRGAIYPQQRLTISTNGGVNFSTGESTVNLAGSAPADASFLLVSGVEYPVAYSTMTSWSIEGIRLIPGANNLMVTGFDFTGNLVDSDTITVTYTGAAWNPPAITALEPAEAQAGEDITILGGDFHDGLRVFFGAAESPRVVFDEGTDAGTITARVPPGFGTVGVTVRNLDDQESDPAVFTYVEPPSVFLRGDANNDSVIDISDAVSTLLYLFSGATTDCEDAMDVNDDEEVNITDVIRLLGHLFQGGAEPAPPVGEPGPDPSGDALGCQR